MCSSCSSGGRICSSCRSRGRRCSLCSTREVYAAHAVHAFHAVHVGADAIYGKHTKQCAAHGHALHEGDAGDNAVRVVLTGHAHMIDRR